MQKNKTSPIWTIEIEKFKEIINTSYTFKDVLFKLNLQAYTGGNYRTLKKRILEEQIDVTHIRDESSEGRRKALYPMRSKGKLPINEILVINSTYKTNLKKRLFEEKLLENKCSKCGIGPEWNGEPISLQVDHINGINNDNRIENLRILCPNCHSQTKTYGGKNSKSIGVLKIKYNCIECKIEITKYSKKSICFPCHQKSQRIVERPEKDILLQEIITLGFSAVGRKYNVSDAAIRKWCKAYDLPTRLSDIKLLGKELNTNESN